ncbi:hypothetical protein TIFTF001_037477 [Ficus carica]|uniref:Uncharacterized protein n=1 Tax=Ficus carica TaxID=3494 RepID=A0AA88JC56_FICCA|nr:hypothetical protein TIFTF001_037477 [Ficus carica]
MGKEDKFGSVPLLHVLSSTLSLSNESPSPTSAIPTRRRPKMAVPRNARSRGLASALAADRRSRLPKCELPNLISAPSYHQTVREFHHSLPLHDLPFSL